MCDITFLPFGVGDLGVIVTSSCPPVCRMVVIMMRPLHLSRHTPEEPARPLLALETDDHLG